MAAGRHVPAVPGRGRGHRAARCSVVSLHDAGRARPGRPHRRRPTVKKAQEGVLEFLLANHPLDCPVCDKGGECPLQDQAFSHGPGESRFVEEKRHFEKPIPISDLVYLDRERCILCDRCTRFAKEVAGDPLIHFTSRGNNDAGPDVPRRARSPPTSAATPCRSARSARSRPSRTGSRPGRGTSSRPRAPARRARSGAASPCSRARTSCCATRASTATRSTGAGCATRAASPSRRSPRRSGCTAPLVRQGDELVPTTWGRGPRRGGRPHHGRRWPTAVRRRSPSSAGLAGTNEDAYAWAKLAERSSAPTNVDAQLGDGLDPAVLRPARGHDRRGVRAATTVVLLGPDLKEELPVLYLRLRDAAEKRRTPPPRAQPEGHGPDPATRGAPCATSRASRRARRRGRLLGRGRRVAEQLRHAARSWSSSVGPTWPSRRTSAPHARRCAARPDAAAPVGPRVLAGAAPRQRPRGALARRARPGRGRPRHRRASSTPPPTGASAASSCSAPTRCPTSPTRDAGRRGARRRAARSSPSTPT